MELIKVFINKNLHLNDFELTGWEKKLSVSRDPKVHRGIAIPAMHVCFLELTDNADTLMVMYLIVRTPKLVFITSHQFQRAV